VPCQAFRNDSADASWSDDDGVELFEGGVLLGDSGCTGNEAEYMGLIMALFYAVYAYSTAHVVQAAKFTCNITPASKSMETQVLSSSRWQVIGKFAAIPCKLCITCATFFAAGSS
jgi:hypothetical protein